VALTISAIRDADGGLSGFSTIARDISTRKQSDQALRQTSAFVRLLQEVAVAANQATSLDQALQTAIDKICEHIGWPVGHIYMPDPAESGALLPTHIWHLEDQQRFDTFRKITEVVRLAPGIGLPGQVMISRSSLWVTDMNLDVSTPRTQLIQDIGVRANFALPVLLGDEVAAVLEFFATEAIEPDDALLDVLHHVGTQLGRVVERARAEAALRAAEAQYRMLVEQLPAIIYTAAINSRSSTSYVSPQIEAILGFSQEEWISNPELWLAQVHPDDRARMLETIGRTHISDTPIPTEYRCFTRDGRLVWLRDTARVVRDESGRPLFMQGITLDITERKRAEEALHASERLYRTLASNFPNGAVVLFDHDLRFTIADGAGLSAFGLTREEMEGYTIWDIPAAWLGVESEVDYRAALAGMPHVREITLGDHAYVVHTLPVRDEHGEIIAGMLMSQDITERKRMEEALIDERALLARRVDERTADLSAANAELARTAMLKDEFLASMSHELRTPLNAVLGLSEALQEEVYGPLNERQRRSLHSIAESGRHLLELINDILDLAKIGAGKLELNLEPTSIETLCQASLRLIKQIAHTKQLSVTVKIDPAVTLLHVDARRVKQILVNLLSNAVKFTPKGGAIGLEVVGDTARQAVDLTVWDTGIGIAQEQMSQLFQPFVQLDRRLARQYEGTGLGLALVYRMVELHGGSITVTSEIGQGSRFTVALPWPAVHMDVLVGTPTAPDVVAIPRPPVRRALVVEDSPTTAEQITRYLHEFAVTSDTVRDGAEVVARALAESPDLILLDLLLGNGSGWDVLAQLKAEPRTRAIPVVVISAIDERARGLALGAADYLVKPIARTDLQRVLPLLAPAPHGSAFALAPRPISVPVRPTPLPLVLLAEDNEATISMIVDYLGTCGYQVLVARNGAEAITRARESRPAILLMDIQMPGMDGLEATRRIRTIEALVDLPIIALTALAMPGDRERCFAAGANHYLSKPVSLRGLATLIEHTLHRIPASKGAP
jgi:PAS domain S-box-containing protein